MKNNKILTLSGRTMKAASLNICVHRASFVSGNIIFQDNNLTQERTVKDYELVIFLKDGGYFSVNGNKYHIKAGTGRLYRPGDRVFSYRFGDVYAIHFSVDNEETSGKFFESIPTFFCLANAIEEVSLAKKIVDNLLKENVFDCISNLCGLLLRIKEQVQQRKTAKKNETVCLAKSYIDANFHENISLLTLSDRYYVHPVYLQRIFKKEIGMSPTEYLLLVRIKHSKIYLISSNIPIEEIAYKTGFCNSSYFIKVFKSLEGLTPRKYRQKMQNISEL